jgi:hypothetical protein
VPGGLRPVLVAPQLSLIPLAFSYRTIGWILTPRAEHDLVALRAAADRVAAADTRVAEIEIREVREHRLALIVSFERSDEGSERARSRIDCDGAGDVLSAPPPAPTSPPYRTDRTDRTDRTSWAGGGGDRYDGVIPGLQRVRLGELPERAASDERLDQAGPDRAAPDG